MTRRWPVVAVCSVVVSAMGLGLWLGPRGAAAQPTPAAGASTVVLTDDTKSVANLVLRGDVADAWTRLDEVLRRQPNDAAARQMQTWVADYRKLEQERDELHAQETQRALDDARQAIKDKKWRDALRSVRLADELSSEKGAVLKDAWVQELVQSAKDAAQELKDKGEWTEAAGIYSHLAGLYQNDPTRKKEYEETFKTLARHARVAEVYKTDEKDPKRDWRTMLEGVSDKVVRVALQNVAKYYVTKPSFAKMADRALDQMEVLGETASLAKTFPGLADESRRKEYVAGIRALRSKLEAVKEPDAYAAVDLRDLFDSVAILNGKTIKLPDDVVVYEFMEGAMSGLDPFSNVIWPSEMQEFKTQTEGEFSGVGIQIEERDGKLVVVTPLDDSPAYEAGLHAEDVIVKVENETGVHDVTKLTLNQAVKLIKGPKRTRVTLTVFRPSEKKELSFSMFRDTIKIDSVRGISRRADNKWNYWADEGQKIGYVRVSQFSGNTVETLAKVLEGLRSQGMRGLILDLRDNPGGLLNAAEDMADLFISGGTIVSTKGRVANEEIFSATAGADYEDLPLVVMVNEFSASASEIVSGAIKDTQRGLIIGERSFGKGSVQNLIEIKGDQGYVKLTTAKYYLPSGRCLHRDEESKVWGVDPDVEVKLSPEEIGQVFKMRRDNDRLVAHKDNTRLGTAPASAPATQPFKQLSADPQLSMAVMMMRTKLLSRAAWAFGRAQAAAPGSRAPGTE